MKVELKTGVPSVVTGFQNMALWECGYNVCLDVCRGADRFLDKSDPLYTKIKSLALSILLNLSKCSSVRVKRQIAYLSSVYSASRQLGTLLMVARDLNAISFDAFVDMNSKVNIFSEKLGKLIKYRRQKLRNRN